jgi:phosphoesterase RecJ-like protein
MARFFPELAQRFARLLQAHGIEAVCANCDPVPRRVAYLAAQNPFFTPATLPPGDYTAVLVDCADGARVGGEFAARFPQPAASIDHHLSNAHGAAENIVDQAAAATAEIIAGIAFDLDLPVDAIAAKALYAGIITDTGQFRYASTTPRVFELVGRLLACGAEPAEAGFHIYERESFGRMKLLQRFLASLQLECGGRVCVGTLPLGVFSETGTTGEDTEGLVDYARAIDGVEVGVLLEERPHMTKGSLRAKDPALRLDQIAAQFGGGGHACAAGLNPHEPIAAVRPRLLAALQTALTRVDALRHP